MTRTERGVVAVLFIIFLLFTAVGVAFAAGFVYYGGIGVDWPGCGSSWAPCGTFGYAFSSACQFSDSSQQPYFVKNVDSGYNIGYCSKRGGSGTAPPGDERVMESLIAATLAFAVAGFLLGTLGGIFYRRRRLT